VVLPDYAQAQDYFFDNDLTDGLPVAAPPAGLGGVTEAMSELISGMDTDGYDVEVTLDRAQVRLSVKARPGSCPTCLVSEAIFGDLAYNALKAGGVRIARSAMRVDQAA
jgi:hypothetical protein